MRTHARLTMPLAILILMGSAGVASAQSYSQATYYSQSSYDTTPPQNFCARITTTLDDTYLARIAQQKDKMIKGFEESIAKRDQRFLDADARLAAKRNEADARRQSQYARLTALAGSDDAKITAVNTFKDRMTNAIRFRRAAVDAAINQYRAGEGQARQNRNQGFLTAFDAYEKNMVGVVIKGAQDECANGVPSAKVRESFLANVKSHQEGLKSDKTRYTETYRGQITSLVATRKAQNEQALATFKLDAEIARSALLAAFGKRDWLSAQPRTGTAPLTVQFTADLADTFLEPRRDGYIRLSYGYGAPITLCKTWTTGVAECPKTWQGSHVYERASSYGARLFWDVASSTREVIGTERITVTN